MASNNSISSRTYLKFFKKINTSMRLAECIKEGRGKVEKGPGEPGGIHGADSLNFWIAAFLRCHLRESLTRSSNSMACLPALPISPFPFFLGRPMLIPPA